MKKILFPILISVLLIILVFIFFGGIESSILETINAIENKITYFIISFLVLISDIILPIPSSIVMFTNGYVLGLPLGFLNSIVALMLSSTIGYYLGEFTSFGFKSKSDSNVNEILNKYGVLSILLTRGIPILSESLCLVAGYHKISFKKYFLFSFIGYIPICFIYSLFGSIGYSQNSFLTSFVISLLISGLFWALGKKYLNLKIKDSIEESTTANKAVYN